MTTPQYPEGYQPYTGAPGPTGPQPTPPNAPPPYQPSYGSPTPGQPPYSAPPGYGAPPPGYGAPPYGAPGYPPGYAPPPQPAKRSNTGWIIGLSIAAVVVLVCAGCSAAAYFAVRNGVATIATTVGVAETYAGFCLDESSQNYQSAYTYFSTNMQQQLTASAFTARADQLDTQYGTVSSCQAESSSPPQISGSTATVQLIVVRTPPLSATPPASTTPTGSGTGTASTTPTAASGTTFTGALHLVKQGSVWRIDQIDSSLGLT